MKQTPFNTFQQQQLSYVCVLELRRCRVDRKLWLVEQRAEALVGRVDAARTLGVVAARVARHHQRQLVSRLARLQQIDHRAQYGNVSTIRQREGRGERGEKESEKRKREKEKKRKRVTLAFSASSLECARSVDSLLSGRE